MKSAITQTEGASLSAVCPDEASRLSPALSRPFSANYPRKLRLLCQKLYRSQKRPRNAVCGRRFRARFSQKCIGVFALVYFADMRNPSRRDPFEVCSEKFPKLNDTFERGIFTYVRARASSLSEGVFDIFEKMFSSSVRMYVDSGLFC